MKYALYVKGERGIQSLRGLLNAQLKPVVCVSEQDDPEIKGLCSEAGVAYAVEKAPKRQEHLSFVHDFGPELIVCAGYSKILPGALFESLKHGGVNCHGGRLPEYRGASPVPWQIIQGETFGFAYVLKMTPGVDDGPVLASARYEIGPDDTARQVTDRVTTIFNRIVPEVVGRIARGEILEGSPQVGESCHWTRRTPDDGCIQWQNWTVREVVDHVRGLDDPYPGAFLLRGDKRVIVKKARAYSLKVRGIPGRFVGKSKEGALILARDGAVEVLTFIMDGKTIAGPEYPAKYGETYSSHLNSSCAE